jgi:hypothetical protein
MRYEVLVCPECGEQLEDDREYGASCFKHNAEPITVEAYIDEAQFASKRGLALFRNAQEQRERDFLLAQNRWFRSLPKEEQKRLTEERRAGMDPMTRMLDEYMEASVKEMRDNLNRGPFWTELSGGYTTVPTKDAAQ